MTQPFAIMFVGRTHSGKTTVGTLLAKELNFVLLDVDELDQFVKDHYPQIIEFELKQRQFYNTTNFKPFLKLELQRAAYEYAIDAGLGVVLSNGHSTKPAKEHQKQTALAKNITLVAINFQISDENIEERIRTANKPTKILTVSKDFMESFKRQSVIFSFADNSDADYVFDVDATKPPEVVVEDIVVKLREFELV